MKYIIIDGDTGLDCGGSIERHWNSLQDFNKWYLDYGINENFNKDKLRALLMFGVKPLLDDIYNLAYIQGTAEKNTLDDSSKAAKALSYYISISESRNLPLVRRSMDLALSECEHFTYLLTKHSIKDDLSVDDHLNTERNEYLVEMRVEQGFSDTSVWHMLRAIHDYLVDKVLWEWAKLTYPKFADYWKERMEAAVDTIKEEADKGNGDRIARLAPAW